MVWGFWLGQRVGGQGCALESEDDYEDDMAIMVGFYPADARPVLNRRF